MNNFHYLLRQLRKRARRRLAVALGAELYWSGHVQIALCNNDGTCQVYELDNVITNDGKNLLRDALQGAQTDCTVGYIALGSGSTAEDPAQHQLVTEQFRKATTKFTTTGLTNGQVQTICYVAPNEANSFTINEIGWFATPLATTTPNSGVMIARVVLGTPINKTTLQSIQFTRTDSIG